MNCGHQFASLRAAWASSVQPLWLTTDMFGSSSFLIPNLLPSGQNRWEEIALEAKGVETLCRYSYPEFRCRHTAVMASVQLSLIY